MTWGNGVGGTAHEQLTEMENGRWDQLDSPDLTLVSRWQG